MRTLIDDRLREEARRFTLRFTCDDCAHFDPEGVRCAEGYPHAPHRGVRMERVRELLFCKSFELC